MTSDCREDCTDHLTCLSPECDQAYRHGWADGEKFVLDNWREYAILRWRLGRLFWRLRSRWRLRNARVTEVAE